MPLFSIPDPLLINHDILSPICCCGFRIIPRTSFQSKKHPFLSLLEDPFPSETIISSIGSKSVEMIHTYATALNLFLSGGSVNKESACNAEDPDSILGQEAPLEKEMATHFTILA